MAHAERGSRCRMHLQGGWSASGARILRHRSGCPGAAQRAQLCGTHASRRGTSASLSAAVAAVACQRQLSSVTGLQLTLRRTLGRVRRVKMHALSTWLHKARPDLQQQAGHSADREFGACCPHSWNECRDIYLLTGGGLASCAALLLSATCALSSGNASSWWSSASLRLPWLACTIVCIG